MITDEKNCFTLQFVSCLSLNFDFRCFQRVYSRLILSHLTLCFVTLEIMSTSEVSVLALGLFLTSLMNSLRAMLMNTRPGSSSISCVTQSGVKTGVGVDANLSVLVFGYVTYFHSFGPLHTLRLESSWMKCPEPNFSTCLWEDILQKIVRRIIFGLTLS